MKELLINLLNENIEYDSLIKDNRLTLNVIKQRLSKIPSKLYKYREGNLNDLDSLENDYVWFTQPKKCDDELDCTLKYNLNNHKDKILEYILLHMDDIVYNYICILFEKNNIELNISKEEIIKIKNLCFDSKGNIIEKTTREYLKECNEKFSFDLTKKAVDATKKYFDNKENDFERLFKMIIDVLNSFNDNAREKTMVYSLCEDYNNESLWSKYANQCKGYCIEYSFDNIDVMDYDDVKNLMYLLPIYYGEKEEFNISPFLKRVLNCGVFKINEEGQISKEEQLEMNLQLFTKNPTWSWQKEWRMFLSFKNNNKQRFPFISKVILGSKIELQLKNKVILICQNKKIPVYQMRLDESKSTYIYEELDL